MEYQGRQKNNKDTFTKTANPVQNDTSAQLAKNPSGGNQIQQLQSQANSSGLVGGLTQLQSMADQHTDSKAPIQRKENTTGLPDQLKSGVENLSGMSLDDVKVHRNSDKPAQLNAHAYAQGTDIHLGPGQEKHLPHEAWHVVQQKEGRVKPTKQMKGKVNVNDDAGLEKEADIMGQKALQMHQMDPEADDYINNDFNGVAQLQSIADARENSQTNNRKLEDWLDKIIDGAIEALNYHESVDQSWLPFDHLLYLQKNLEYYRDNCSPEYWKYYSESWRELHTAVISEIRSVNDSVVPSDGSVGTGTDLAFSMQPSLQSLAMAIGVRNQGAWDKGDIAENHHTKIEEQREQEGLNFKPMPLNLGADNEKSIERKGEIIDKNETAVCSEFAAAAANILKGKGVRVEICGSIKGHHNFVVVGRPQGSNIGDKSTWGNAAIVDCWMGALWWSVGESYPDVVYVPTEHEFPISEVAWDSDSQQAEASGGDAASDRPKGGIGNLLTSFKLRKTGIDNTK